AGGGRAKSQRTSAIGLLESRRLGDRNRRRRAPVHSTGGSLRRAPPDRRRNPAEDLRSSGDGKSRGIDASRGGRSAAGSRQALRGSGSTGRLRPKGRLAPSRSGTQKDA